MLCREKEHDLSSTPTRNRWFAVVFYMLLAKRLFGLRGGGRAAAAARARDTGWAALERVLPGSGPGGSATSDDEVADGSLDQVGRR